MKDSSFLTYLIILLSSLTCGAFNVRQTSNNDGLSNSAILSLDRDENGYLWVGTCDGINIADGAQVKPFSSVFPGIKISGNIIEAIMHIGKGRTLVLTNFGLDYIDLNKGTSRSYPQYRGQEIICADEKGNVFIVTEKKNIHYMPADDPKGEFRVLAAIPNDRREIKAMTVSDGKLRLITRNGIIIYDLRQDADGKTLKGAGPRIADRLPVKFAKVDGKDIFIVDGSNRLMEITPQGKRRFIIDLDGELSKRNEISDLVHDRQGNFFMSFSTDGAMWIGRDDYGKIIPVDLGLKVGVFCLEKSPDQDVVWVGSDCQGVYTYWDGKYSIRSFSFADFNNMISHPVRAIFLDDAKNFWLATKGSGLLKIPGFNEFYPRPHLSSGTLYTSSNSDLLHNSVFAFGKSKHPVLWIATEEGINYYSYGNDRINHLPLNPAIKYIHGVYEENDSTLWLATLGYGIGKAKIKWNGNTPTVTDLKVYSIDNGIFSSNLFFSLSVDDKGRLLFCNRGRGVDLKEIVEISVALAQLTIINAVEA